MFSNSSKIKSEMRFTACDHTGSHWHDKEWLCKLQFLFVFLSVPNPRLH